MAANNSQLADALSGAFLEIAVVTDIGTASESESIVGYTKGETTLTKETTDMEVQFHESKYTQTFTQHENLSLEFMTQFTAGMAQLQTLNIVDSNGDPVSNQELDIRVYVYDEDPDIASSAGQVVELYRCEIDWGEGTLAQDNSELPITANVNGGIKWAKS